MWYEVTRDGLVQHAGAPSEPIVLAGWQMDVIRRLSGSTARRKRGKQMQTFINKKTQQEYEVLYTARDMTSARNVARVVVYRRASEPNKVFVCDEGEFHEKFTLGSEKW